MDTGGVAMSWVRFTADYDWKPTPATTVAYKAGMTQFVTRACATLAVAASKAVRVNKKAEGSDADEE